MTRAVLLAAVALSLLAAVASGCGSSGSSDEGVAAIDTGASASGDGGSSTTPQQANDDPQETALKWARCMRENGVDVPDPQVDSNGRLTVRSGAGAFRPGEGNDSEFRAAIEKCGSPLGNARPQLTDAEREQLQESMLEFAACMRKQGVDMPDPDFSEGGGAFRVMRGGDVDPSDPDFQKAQKACQPILQEVEDTIRPGGRG
jgi:hypothetical protein